MLENYLPILVFIMLGLGLGVGLELVGFILGKNKPDDAKEDIVSDSADNKLWITNCVNGFLFRSGSSKSLYKSIISAIDKKNIWDKISVKARKTITDRNDITNEMIKMYKLMKLI